MNIESLLKEKGTVPKRVSIHITKETERSGLDGNILETTINKVQAPVILSFGKNTPHTNRNTDQKSLFACKIPSHLIRIVVEKVLREREYAESRSSSTLLASQGSKICQIEGSQEMLRNCFNCRQSTCNITDITQQK